jgi:hypothetical protein
MNPVVDEAIDFIYGRARDTKAVMTTLTNAPYNWSWGGISPENFRNMIDGLNTQMEVLNNAETATSLAAGLWDREIASLLGQSMLGASAARAKWVRDAVKLQFFQGLRHGGRGRDVSYHQLLDFESAWRTTDPAWVFETGLTLAIFKQRREALRLGLEVAHVDAEKNEAKERSILHLMANDVNEVCVGWYEVATSKFDPDSVPGALVRTIPTTYNPSQPPGPLQFTAHMAVAPNQVHLLWRAPRGEKFFISGKGPGDAQFQLLLDGGTDKEWIGMGVAAGAWEFKGHATNQFGQGAESEIVAVNVPAAAAA